MAHFCDNQDLQYELLPSVSHLAKKRTLMPRDLFAIELFPPERAPKLDRGDSRQGGQGTPLTKHSVGSRQKVPRRSSPSSCSPAVALWNYNAPK